MQPSTTFDLLTLSLLPDVRPLKIRELLTRAPAHEVLAHPAEHGDVLGERSREELRSGTARRAAEAEQARATALGVTIAGLDDPAYPPLLKRIFDPPPVLYVRGRLQGAEGSCAVAVVGARAATPAGRTLARGLGRDLAAGGITVVSGLARGIDTCAHEGALLGHGRTVAVLGSGLERIYPPEGASLARAIEAEGAVVSEFPLDAPPLPHHFLRRNRVIAGWGRAVVVVEAARRSGALNTARAALDEGREVMAVPGHPSVAAAEGTNLLIRDGARLVQGAQDVAEELGLALAPTRPAPEMSALLGALRPDVPATLEELRRRSGLETDQLLARLTEMELRDEVRRLPGALFVRLN